MERGFSKLRHVELPFAHVRHDSRLLYPRSVREPNAAAHRPSPLSLRHRFFFGREEGVPTAATQAPKPTGPSLPPYPLPTVE